MTDDPKPQPEGAPPSRRSFIRSSTGALIAVSIIELIAAPSSFAQVDLNCGTDAGNGSFNGDNHCSAAESTFDEDQSCAKNTLQQGADSPDESCGGHSAGPNVQTDPKDESCNKRGPVTHDPDDACGITQAQVDNSLMEPDATCDKAVTSNQEGTTLDTDETCGMNVPRDNSSGFDGDNYCEKSAGRGSNPTDADESCGLVLATSHSPDESCSGVAGQLDPDGNCTRLVGGVKDPDESRQHDTDGDGDLDNPF